MKTIFRLVLLTIASLIFIHACAKNSTANIVCSISLNDSLNKLKVNYPGIYQNLIQEFKKIENLKYSIEGDALYVAFQNNANKTSAVFSFDGKRRYSITNTKGDLPKPISEKIKNEYPTYTIFSKKTIKTENETIYQVIVENNNEYRVINFLNEEMEELQKIRKSL